jgi:DNA polymerase-1
MPEFKLVTERYQLEEMIDLLRADSYLVLDLMTTGSNPNEDVIVGWILAGITNPEVFYVPVGHLIVFENLQQLPRELVAERICELIDGKPLVGYDLFSAFGFIEKLDSRPTLIRRSDVMVEAFTTGRFSDVSLNYIAKALYGETLKEIQVLYPAACERIKNKRVVHFEKIPIEIAFEYACGRGNYIRRIHQDLFDSLMSDPRLKRIYQIEMDVLPVAAKMHDVGIRVDFEKCRSEHSRLKREAENLTESIHDWLRRNFNITAHFDFGSSRQTANLLIDKLHMLEEVRTPRGHRSTSKKVYEGLRDSNPLVNAIFTYRELIRTATGFYGIYPRFEGSDGRMHPRLLTCHVISGRTASADPNCQQIPRESIWEFVDFSDHSSDECVGCSDGNCRKCSKVKKKNIRTAVREVFIPREGYMFIEGDYSQIELVVLAGASGELEMLKAFRDGEDIHEKTAALIFDVPLDQITEAQRQVGKTTNFRFAYGGGPGGLAAQLGLSLEQAYQIYAAYRKAYKMVDRYAERSAREAARRGYVETLFGRRRYMDEFTADDSKVRAKGRRLSTNLQIQGGAADIAKIGLIRQDQASRQFDEKFKCKTYLCNFAHDSFLWELPVISSDQKEQARFVRKFIEVMRSTLCFDVSELVETDQFPKLEVDFKMGMNYHSMTKEEDWLELS